MIMREYYESMSSKRPVKKHGCELEENFGDRQEKKVFLDFIGKLSLLR
jgi:hypothetical protein